MPFARSWITWTAVVLLTLVVASLQVVGAGARVRHTTHPCVTADRSPRIPANPLNLRTPRGPDPLSGARFFVPGPATGMAAGAIATMLGRNPARYGTTTWSRFARSLTRGSLARVLRRDPGLAHRVDLLAKIAGQPDTARFSIYSGGGGPGAIYSQVRKFLCRVAAMDRLAVPLIATYFLNHSGDCHSNVDGPVAQTVFRRRVRELARGLGSARFVMFAELDAVTTAGCLSRAGLAVRISELKFEVDQLAALRHGVVYVEGGASDSTKPRFAASILNRVDIRRIRGFFLGDTHFAWTQSEIAFGTKVSRLTRGAHFVVNTAANGNGPKLNRHPRTQGNEDLCNPPGRGLGPPPTTSTGSPQVDAFVWTGSPGRSAGNCGIGTAPSGTFDLNLALHLAALANNRLGPHQPSRPY